jgi:hypothetical protein
VTPKDFYFAQVLRQNNRSYVELISRLLLNPEILEHTSITKARTVIKWGADTLLDQTVLTVENWLEVAFHLCKQRWDSSIDWLETQPMSKINAMIDIMKTFADDQEKAMKKNARKK